MEKLTIDDLKEPVAKLHALLQDPQPGLMTWWDFFLMRVKEVSGLLNRVIEAPGQRTVENPMTPTQFTHRVDYEALARFIKNQMTVPEIIGFLRTVDEIGERYQQFLSANKETRIAYLDSLEETL
jgi:hypothetical protein